VEGEGREGEKRGGEGREAKGMKRLHTDASHVYFRVDILPLAITYWAT